jgi:adenine-specific DNA-methyltransferase
MGKRTLAKKPKKPATKQYEVSQITHTEDKRKNIPTAEYQAVVEDATKQVIPVTVKRRNPDMDPQLVWRGKEDRDWTSLSTQAPPLYIQEKLHPKAIIDDLVRRSDADRKAEEIQPNLFADFNGISDVEKTEFYKHEQNWSNRMILGDSLLVMASLSVREDLQGKVQCIYFDPPYGIKFNSNFQWSTTSRDVKDGNPAHISREPEQVKAFRDTWRDGVHSYLSYIRDRLTIARELLAETGSVFVQIGDENVHRVRDVMDEVFGEENFISIITIKKTAAQTDKYISSSCDYIIWYAKSRDTMKYRQVFLPKDEDTPLASQYRWVEFANGIRKIKADLTSEEKTRSVRLWRPDNLTSSHEYSLGKIAVEFEGKKCLPGPRHWTTSPEGFQRLKNTKRLCVVGSTLSYVRYLDDFPVSPILNVWTDTGTGGYGDTRYYVVQTTTKVIQRCILMTTDPGDLVLDPTCGSGTTAYVAEQWGRRWITIDTSRVALALARARLMGARYPYYFLADSDEGQFKEAELRQTIPSREPTYNRIRHGFVYERVPHITLKSIANNTEIDVIHEKYREEIENALKEINSSVWGADIAFTIETGVRKGGTINFGKPSGKTETLPSGEAVSADELLEWEVPLLRSADGKSPAGFEKAARPLAKFWEAKLKCQKEIDASIAAKAEFEYLYDKPYEDNKKIRVAGPFTVESASPHRALDLDENGDFVTDNKIKYANGKGEYAAERKYFYGSNFDGGGGGILYPSFLRI